MGLVVIKHSLCMVLYHVPVCTPVDLLLNIAREYGFNSVALIRIRTYYLVFAGLSTDILGNVISQCWCSYFNYNLEFC